jgi:hypothetical protein
LIDNKAADSDIHKSVTLKSLKLLHATKGYDSVRIVDFGGGCGVSVPHILKVNSEFGADITTMIMDSKANTELGKSMLGNEFSVEFINYNMRSLSNVLKQLHPEENEVVLNISSVPQYIIPSKDFLRATLSTYRPNVVCIARFPKSEFADDDASAIQDITTPLGFRGSTIVNLFGPNRLFKHIGTLGYEVICEDYNFTGDTDYFANCDEPNYKKMTLVAYVFVRRLYKLFQRAHCVRLIVTLI